MRKKEKRYPLLKLQEDFEENGKVYLEVVQFNFTMFFKNLNNNELNNYRLKVDRFDSG